MKASIEILQANLYFFSKFKVQSIHLMPSPKNLYIFLLLIAGTPLFVCSQDLAKVNDGNVIMHPKVSFDGEKLVFIANYFGALGPFISSLDSGNWGTPQPLFSNDIRKKYEILYPQLNFDNTKLYFSAKEEGRDHFDIFFSELKNGEWSEPTEVPMRINTEVDELAPAVSADEKKILFTRPLPPEAKADKICNEIYISELAETGVWSEPTLLPPAYNTGCLCAPYFTRDNKSFFFSSYEEIAGPDGRRISKNNFNVFWAKIDGVFKFTPKPLLSLVSETDIVSFSLDADSTYYYGSGRIFEDNQSRMTSKISSGSLKSEFAPDDMTLISGVVNDENQQPLVSNVQIINPFTTKVFQEVVTNQSGYYQVFVPAEEQFSVLATRDGYSAQSKLIETEGSTVKTNFDLFPRVSMTFNVFDEDFYFPILAEMTLYDSEFNLLKSISGTSGEQTEIELGKELNIIFQSENYFADTLHLPFDKEVIFSSFDFDIELKRKLKEVAFTFSDDETGNSLGLEIVVYNVTRNEKTKRQVKDGSIRLELRDGEVYEISTSAQGYSYYTADLDLSKEEEIKEVKAELKAVENISIVLDNITFEYNSYSLNAISYKELNRLVSYLEENDDYKVEVSAHTDDSGSPDYNLKLSNLRANSVLQYLEDKSIERTRLEARGYGESAPRHPNDTEENRAKNRRVEFKILATE